MAFKPFDFSENDMNARARRLFALVLTGATLGGADAIAQDGFLDTTFGIDGRSEFIPQTSTARAIFFNAIEVLPNGSLLAAGYIDYARPGPLSEPNTRGVVAKLGPDGAPDATFGSAPDYPGMVIFDDLSVGSRIEEAKAITVLDDGSVVVGGSLDAWTFGGFTARIDATGDLVDSHGDGGVSLLPLQVFDMDVDSRGRVVLAGDSRNAIGTHHGTVARIEGKTGALDPEFGTGGIVELLDFADDGSVLEHQGGLLAVAIGAGDIVVVGGYQDGADFSSAYSLAKLVDGALDPSFAADGWLKFAPPWSPASLVNVLSDIAITPEGNIAVAGEYRDDQFRSFPMLARFSADGMPDDGFGESAWPGFQRLDVRPGFGDQHPTALVLQRDGKIVFAAKAMAGDQPPDFIVGRVDARGRPDKSFGTGGIALIDTPPPSIFAHALGITVQGDLPIVAGADGRRVEEDGPVFVRATVMRLSTDRVFSSGFDAD